MRKKINNLVIGLLTATTMISFTPQLTFAATAPVNNQKETIEYTSLTGYKAPKITVTKVPVSASKASDVKGLSHRVKARNSQWSQYSSDYFYNQMNSDEKALYDSLTSSADEIMDSSQNYTVITGKYTNLSSEVAQNITYIWNATEAQYFFTTNHYNFTHYSDNSGTVTIDIMDKYKNGNALQADKQTFISTINTLLQATSSSNTDLENEKAIHDALVRRLTWDDTHDDNKQSAASSLIDNNTVCAGYASAFEILMNALNVPTISITSSNHQWNEIYLGGNWYGVDVTWDDPRIFKNGSNLGNSFTDGSNIQYDYLNVSDSTLQSGSSTSGGSHTPNSFWDSYGRPACTIDGRFNINTSNSTPSTNPSNSNPSTSGNSSNTRPSSTSGNNSGSNYYPFYPYGYDDNDYPSYNPYDPFYNYPTYPDTTSNTRPSYPSYTPTYPDTTDITPSTPSTPSVTPSTPSSDQSSTTPSTPSQSTTTPSTPDQSTTTPTTPSTPDQSTTTPTTPSTPDQSTTTPTTPTTPEQPTIAPAPSENNDDSDDETPAVSQKTKNQVKASKTSISAKKGKTQKINIKKNSSVKSITYKSSKKSVATVSKSGKVKFKKKGSATITATVTFVDGSTKTIKVKVKCK